MSVLSRICRWVGLLHAGHITGDTITLPFRLAVRALWTEVITIIHLRHDRKGKSGWGAVFDE